MAENTGREDQLLHILHDYLQAVDAGRAPDRAELLKQHPDFADDLAAFFAEQAKLDEIASPLRPAPPATEAPTIGHTPSAAPVAGSLVRYFGNYEILDEIARGGMGVVYRARQRSLQRVVALKMILAGQLASAEEVKRFYSEAQTAAKLQHPNIVAIIEVGDHDGQHYFSMDYVDGRSLAERVQAAPLEPRQAARYVKLVADAIHYAHQQGVLHRDLKPSNVLIDPFDQPRVTDFGLARSITSDKGLTATGAVVGTPGYMPPEQASADRGKMGPASDVYSLGAVLYELVTGRPPFRAATPLDTLLQVLSAEPAAPRLLNAAVDRDLETIVLKCLAKDPKRRYPTAQALSDDLQAFLDGKQIQARRPSLGERAARWLRQRRQSAKLALLTAGLSVLLLVGAFFGWRGYDDYRRGSFVLRPEGEAYYEAQVFDDKGAAVLEPFTVPTRQPVSLPAGSYDVRLSGLYRLGHSVHLDLPRGTGGQFTVALNGERMREPIPCSVPPRLANVQGRVQLFVPASDDGTLMTRLESVSNNFVWTPIRNLDGNAVQSFFKSGWTPLDVVDLKREGAGHDVLLADRDYAGLLVLSQAGEVVWKHDALPLDADGRPAESRPGWGQMQFEGCIAAPLLLDAGGDSPPACLVVFNRNAVSIKNTQPVKWTSDQRWAEAINLRTGQTLWRRHLDNVRNPNAASPTYTGLAKRDGKPVFAVAYGNHLVTFDARTGTPLFEPVDLGGPPQVPARFADLKGDGEPILLWTVRRAVDSTILSRSIVLSAYSTTTGRALWTHPGIHATLPPGVSLPSMRRDPDWPLPIDVDGQGRCDVVVPCREVNDRFGLELLDGRTGVSRWKNLGWKASAPQSLTVGPALEGGRHDLFTAATEFDLRQMRTELVVTAVAGPDGVVLWQNRINTNNVTRNISDLEPLAWWKPDELGWPNLVVTAPVNQGQETKTWLFHGATGRVTGTLSGLRHLQTADLDGDGLEDLLGWQESQGGRLHFFRGGVPDVWRRFGDAVQVTHDLDGDGVPDLLQGSSAVSGRTGRKLWDAAAPSSPLTWARSDSSVDADLNGDGVPDVVRFQQSINKVSPLTAISGKDGHVLWSANELAVPAGTSEVIGTYKWLAVRRLSQQNAPAVLFGYEYQRLTNDSLHLAVLDGGTGKVCWRQEIGPEREVGGSYASNEYEPQLVDLNGDGVLDIVTWAVDANGMFEIRGLDGRDGQILWRQPVYARRTVTDRPPAFCTVPGTDGEPPAVLVRFYPDGFNVELRLLDGRDGSQRWSWKKADLYPDQAVLRDLRPAAVRFRPKDAPVLALITSSHQIYLLNPDGKERATINLATDNRQGYRPTPLLTAELRGDGTEQLIFEQGGEIQVLGDASGGVLWRRRVLPIGSDLRSIREIHAAAGGRPATVVINETASRVTGLNGATGEPIWSCDGAGLPQAVLPDRDGKPPLVVYQHENVSICRRALPVDGNGRFLLPTPSSADYPPPGEDPTSLRPLPWADLARAGGVLAYFPFPAILLYVLWYRRSWRQALALLLSVLFMTATIGSVWLYVDFNSFVEGERYDWSGWYGLPVVVSSGVGMIFFAGYAGLSVMYFLRGLWGGLRGE